MFYLAGSSDVILYLLFLINGVQKKLAALNPLFVEE